MEIERAASRVAAHLKTRMQDDNPVVDAGGMSTPVLLVHGIDDTSERLTLMRGALESRGIGPVHCMDIVPPDASISIEAMGDQVAHQVGSILAAHCADEVDIVAFSMGALAARWYVQELGGHRSVRHLVPLASPHHGTLTAFFRDAVGVRQMRPRSPFLRHLNRLDWGDVDVVSFWSPLDLMVLPAMSSLLDKARNRAFLVAAHPWMITDRRVLAAVCDVLDESWGDRSRSADWDDAECDAPKRALQLRGRGRRLD